MVYKTEKQFGSIKVVQNNGYQWAVLDSNNNVIVPFGKYGWIDGFDSGLCRVRSHGKTTYTKNIIAIFAAESDELITDKDKIATNVKKEKQEHPENFAKWGIINEKGEEVLPVEYDDIWNFFGKSRFSTKVVKDGITSEVYFHNLNPALPVRGIKYKTKVVEDDSGGYFNIDDCYDYEGNFDFERLEDAILDGEYVPEDW